METDKSRDASVTAVLESAEKFLTSAIEHLSVGQEGGGRETDPPKQAKLFPSGIELIKFEFKVENVIDIVLTVAGKDAPEKAAVRDRLGAEGGDWVSSG